MLLAQLADLLVELILGLVLPPQRESAEADNREPLILFYREHQSVERVVEALELPPDAVVQPLTRGLPGAPHPASRGAPTVRSATVSTEDPALPAVVALPGNSAMFRVP